MAQHEEAEAGGSLLIQDQPSLRSEFQFSQGRIVRICCVWGREYE